MFLYVTRRQSLPDMRRVTSDNEQVTRAGQGWPSTPSLSPTRGSFSLGVVAAGSRCLGLGGVLDPLALGVGLRISALNCI